MNRTVSIGNIISLFVVFGGIYLVYAGWTMPTAVSTDYGGQVINLGLLNQQQNYIITGFGTILSGFAISITSMVSQFINDYFFINSK